MSPEAARLLDACLDLLAGKLEARELCDVGFSILCAGLAHLPEERRVSLQAAIPDSLENGVAGMARAGRKPVNDTPKALRILH